MPLSIGYGLQAAGMYANVVIAMPMSIEEGRAQREAVRQAARLSGREPDDIKFLVVVGMTVGRTKQEALDMRRALDDQVDLDAPLSRLSAYLGMRGKLERPDEPLTPPQLALLQARPNDVRSVRTVALARAGYSPREILAHAVLDPYPVLVGTAERAADFLQEWLEAEAADGFMHCFDDYHTGIDAFVDHVVPILRERGLFSRNDEGMTLRSKLGLRPQYGVNARIGTASK